MAQLHLDALGWTYFGLFIAWNLALASGMAFLWTRRQLPSLRIRRIPLLLVGVFFLHSYAMLCLIAYPIQEYISCTLEFWVMSILVPFGIALFHAANSQFLHMASRQKQFARMSSLKDHKSIDEQKAQAIMNSRWKRIWAGVERADNINQTLVMIGVGMVVQVRYTFVIPVCTSLTTILAHAHIPCLLWVSLFMYTMIVRQTLTSYADLKNFIQATVSSTTQSRVLGWKFEWIVVRAGSGGSQLCGNCSGLGYTHPTCSGRVAVSVTFMVGERKLSASVLLGKLVPPLRRPSLTAADSQQRPSGLQPCMLRNLPRSTLSYRL
jgi:hypothetical protein